MADVTPESTSVSGVEMTVYAAADPLTITNNGRVHLIAINNSGAARTFEIVTSKVEESDLAVADRPISIGAAAVYTGLGTYSTSLYNDGSGEITLQNFNDVTDLSFLAIQV